MKKDEAIMTVRSYKAKPQEIQKCNININGQPVYSIVI